MTTNTTRDLAKHLALNALKRKESAAHKALGRYVGAEIKRYGKALDRARLRYLWGTVLPLANKLLHAEKLKKAHSGKGVTKELFQK